MGAILVGLKHSLRMSVIRAVVLLSTVAGVLLAWQSLWQEYPKARQGLYSRRIDSYLPDLGSFGPEAFLQHKEGARFLAYYQLIEREAPGSAGVNEMLGYCHYYSGHVPEAVAYLERALRADPDSFVARYNLGLIYYAKDDFERSLGYFQKAVSLPEGRAFGYVMNARVFSQFRVVKKITPGDVRMRLRLEYDDAKRFIRICMGKLGRTKDVYLLAMQYNDLRAAWTRNNGAPSTWGLIVF